MELKKITGLSVPIDAWFEVELPPHLKINIQIIDNDGNIIKQGRDLKALKQFLSGEMQETAASMHSHIERSQLTSWDFGILPETVSIKQGKMEVVAYPAIIAEEDSVAIKAVPNKAEAEQLSQKGLRQLFMLQCKKELKLLKSLPNLNALSLKFSANITKQQFIDDFVAKVFDRVFLAEDKIRDQQAFGLALSNRGQLYPESLKLIQQLESMANPYQELMKLFSRPVPNSFSVAYQDMQKQLQQLIQPGFMQNTQDEWFKRLSVYLQALLKRSDKLKQNLEKDRQNMLIVQGLEQAYQALGEIKKAKLMAEDFSWLLQELRVSLFAQELKTAVSVSEQKLKKLLQH
jgi:ATP-dependent helicase HrpA